MTKLVQEALDRYLEPYGGVAGLLEGGVAEPEGLDSLFGCDRRSSRSVR